MSAGVGGVRRGYRGPVPVLPAVDVVGYVLADLGIILLAARLVGSLFVRLRQPRVAGEMVAGILIGPTVLGAGPAAALYPPQAFAFLTLLGVLALVLFTFLVGMEVPQHLLRGAGTRVTIVGVAVVAASVGLGFALAPVLGAPGVWRVAVLPDGRVVPPTAHALLLAAGLAATALPVIARILQDKQLMATPVGALGIGVSAVVTPLTFLLVTAAAAALAGRGVPAEVALRLAATAVLVAVLVLVVRPLLRRLLARAFRPGGLDPGLLAVLLAGALLTALAADRIGIHALTGGLLFGAAVPQVPGLGAAVRARLGEVVAVLGIPVFLAVSGLQTDLRVLRPEHLGAIALFLGAVAVAKWGVGTAVGRACGLPGRQAGAAGVLLSCGGLVTLVVALAGRQLGLVTAPMQVVLAVTAIVSTLATGPLLDRYLAGPAAQAPMRPRPGPRSGPRPDTGQDAA